MSKFTDRLQAQAQAQAQAQGVQNIYVSDPTKTMLHTDDAASYGQGLWSQITSTSSPYTNTIMEDPFETRLKEMENQMQLVQLDLKLYQLEILSLKGKFTQEEVTNIRNMLMSEDEASRILANTILENAG
jgi:hypothetical protein